MDADDRMIDMVAVRLVGGPQDWSGKVLEYPRSTIYGPDAEPGAYLISSDTPPRQEGEDPDPRAVYEPEEGGDAAVWHFQGWFPPAPGDPPPGWYLSV